MSYADTVGELREAGLDRREAEAIAIREAGPPPWPVEPEEDE